MIQHKQLENGFEYIEISNEASQAKIALQGAHIFEYKRKGEEDILWLSETSDFEKGKAIRGGVPLCWPSFGMNNPDLPQHGFARLGMWKVARSQETDSKTTQLVLELNETPESLKLWPYRFHLELRIRVSDTLCMELTTTNTDEREFKITQALHSYFLVSDISDAAVKGLDAKPYFDALSAQTCVQKGDVVFMEEVDRVYQDVKEALFLSDKNRVIKIQNEGSSSVVVWNPWIEKCSRMSGMKEDAYLGMVCIESANAYGDFKILKPRASHTLKALIS
ncbi:D-hexose-6-phosphate mutarotase [bacterium]|nr:D-hexose-6-phosphate mutarotase [bacterium]MBU1990586.1 D-hexose-6-phosphate mutarotase [bacterium]